MEVLGGPSRDRSALSAHLQPDMRVASAAAAFFSSTTRRLQRNPRNIQHARQMATSEMASYDGSGQVPAPLVDVDCNLLHEDFIKAMVSISTVKVDGVDDAWKILHHPSTAQSNIVAMISPSSTLDESELSVQLLENSTINDRNGIDVKTSESLRICMCLYRAIAHVHWLRLNHNRNHVAVGVHPYHVLEVGEPDAETTNRLRKLLDENKSAISCIGECGLDYMDGFPDSKHQVPWFKAQLELAIEYQLPIFLHERIAFDDTTACIDEAAQKHGIDKIPRIIVHCYTGTLEQCKEYMRRGYYISFSGFVNKPGSEEVKSCLRSGVIPLDKIMIETDAPYLGFDGCKDAFFDAEGDAFSSLSAKKRKKLKSHYPNVPSALPMVLETVQREINAGRGERGDELLSIEQLARITSDNACSFFGLDRSIIKR